MKFWSDDIKPNEVMSTDHVLSADYGFGCEGGNISPSLSWSDLPADATHVTVLCFDPDAPTGSGFWHWLVANIPVQHHGLERHASGEGKIPEGAMETRTDFGKPGWGGPCPPEGDKPHAYVFTLHAHKGPIQVYEDIPAAQVGFQLHFASIAETSFTGFFGR
jgi:hypothetical protein